MNLIKVVFGSSTKEYSYAICDYLAGKLNIDDKIQIRNEAGWDYRGETVKVTMINVFPNSQSLVGLKEIVAFKREGLTYWTEKLTKMTITSDGKIFIQNANSNDVIKGDNTMNRIFGNVAFGKYTGNQLRMSIKGIAYLNDNGSWVVWDNNTSTFVDVNDFIFDGNDSANLIYLMPVAINNIAVGDIIKHNDSFVIVREVNNQTGRISVYDPHSNELRVILPVRNIFGFDFYTKVVSLIDSGVFGTATAENPFGNMLPFFLMNKSDNSNMKDLMLMSMISGGDSKNLLNNPMMMYMLMGDKNGKDDLLPLMLMMNGGGVNNPFAMAAEGQKEFCEQKCGPEQTCKH